MKVASLRLINSFVRRKVVVTDGNAATSKRLHSILTSRPVIRRHIITETLTWWQSLFVLNWTIHSSLQVVVVEAHWCVQPTWTFTLIWVLVQYLMSCSSSLLLQQSISASQLSPVLSWSRCIWSVLYRLCIIILSILSCCSWTTCLINLTGTLCISLASIIWTNILIIDILNLVNGVFSNIQLIVCCLILQSLVLRTSCNTGLLKILRFHELLTRLSVRLHRHCILNKAELIRCSPLLFHVLTPSWWRWHLVVVSSPNRSLCWDRRLWLHEISRVNLIGSQHLLCRVAQSWPNGLPTINTCCRHACHSRHVH